jgi:ariadne-1
MEHAIREVNAVIQMPATTVRILLQHFCWDQEKLMERFYDGDQVELAIELHFPLHHVGLVSFGE